MKKAVSLLLIFIVTLCSFSVCAQTEVKVYLEDSMLQFDVPPQIINGRTMVPMRVIYESLGAVVSWDDTTKTASGTKGDVTVSVTINSCNLYKNGKVATVLDVAPVIIDGRTLVPVRAIAESFDCKVDWVDETKTVLITGVNKETPLTAVEISENVAPSVFYVEVYDEKNRALGNGSGFFINSEGVAVTNYHVIEDTASAKITTIDGKVYDVTNIIAYDANLDVAIIKISKKSDSGHVVSAFPAVTMADSDNIKAGQIVYAIGSPRGLQNTISDGIISNPKQTVGDETFIQITAPISHGSSGGALVDEYGKVLGITSAGFENAQNIGFVIPINVVKAFDLNDEGVKYSDFANAVEEFTLDVYPETITVEVGKTAVVFVHAEGKGEWSMYWETSDNSKVSCEWGDWLESDPTVCPLYITGEEIGTDLVKIYSDVDYNGIDISITVEKGKYEYYNTIDIPTYTSVTGVKAYEEIVSDSSIAYAYTYNDIEEIKKYLSLIIDEGYAYLEDAESDEDGLAYYFLDRNDKLMGLFLPYEWDEVWIYVPKN